jgi:hypothetical protein
MRLAVSDRFFKKCWDANGKILSSWPTPSANFSAGHAAYGKKGKTLAFSARFKMAPLESPPDVVFREGSGVPHHTSIMLVRQNEWLSWYTNTEPAHLQTLSVNVGIAAGPWKTVATYLKAGSTVIHASGTDYGPMVLAAYKKKMVGQVDAVVLSACLPRVNLDGALRVRLVGRDGSEYEYGGGITARFWSQPEEFWFTGEVSNVARVEVQTRPYDWTRFPHVRLSPRP